MARFRAILLPRYAIQTDRHIIALYWGRAWKYCFLVCSCRLTLRKSVSKLPSCLSSFD